MALKSQPAAAQLKFGRANVLLLGTAVAVLTVGYVMLAKGSTTGAAVLLVLGYCVLVPLGLAL
ncbi:MAG TPA: hypothetical protein VGI83_01235 [Gemmatimonadales bacterium]|jgi:hypothetical protein